MTSAAATDDNTTYAVVVSNAAGSATSRQAKLNVRIPPQITAQPKDTTVDQGAPVSFTVAATGTTPLSYQWKKNGTDIAGATSATYSIPSAAAADDSARFTVTVTNAAGSATSNQATLRVRTPPTITVQPTSKSVSSGVPATFAVTATGTTVTYQWRRNGANIPGATGSWYTVGVPLAGDNGASYSVVVSNALGSVTSSAAVLTVTVGTGVRPTSYANAKAFNHGPMPASGQWYDEWLAFGNFFGNGNRDYVIATLVYDVSKPIEQAVPGELQFWRWDGGQYVKDAAKVDNATGCIHPRKAVVADFNEDQQPDVFVACHGYDAPPFPGENAALLLSQPNGVYKASKIGPAGFYHSATGMDVNNDGHTDVLVTNNFAPKNVFAFVNDGQGNFTQRTDLLPTLGSPYFSVEAADVNGDGRVDLLVGGHDWEGAATKVLLNDGSGTFANATSVTLPAVANEGVVLDFVVLDADRDGVNEIYVNRTSGGDGTFYQSRVVQKVLWPSLTSSIVINERPGGPMAWLPFLMPVFSGSQYQLVSYRADHAFSVNVP